ncbi:DUF2075 domain-containing protein [Leuconostoc gasicomitatum]|uniref:DNA/RNA helicase domain-containing protein n=1 Tax=Leuconostoc gasicomitatum TaxID=115778 RepID=UPI000BCCF517|nr:DNA/RNA helicase domain-containing protein [Leuconostoc gasicomitatum]MBZ5944911.1 DUF2075 domain-containing protein [Leuconostoc gasicomitatum]MBZ5951154.1 DUF2075 domain-containing protein [Leuconostoc gasicomitatum]MBZ5968507.1 DUF2075 domain-containing protein [Leuconostoc gasicomitatum]QFS15679.1 hypothetical protein BHS03_08625 [Leuconostoc gasicomitatum]SOC24509.1 conserved hypothetical protein [Leuconostoc gasicomitatum]
MQLLKTININILGEINPVKIDGLFLDYSIPGMTKEFDILKVTREFVLNIELKLENKTTDEMRKQLIDNKFYLSKANCQRAYYFSYNAETDKLYELDNNNQLVDVTTTDRIIHLLNVDNMDGVKIEDLFLPSKYLVSPFNDTDRFLSNDYLLTESQKAKKTQILNNQHNEIFIFGNAGTGKTLLLYDIAKYYKNMGKSVFILHCAKLNSGHYQLIQNEFNIFGLKQYSEIVEKTSDPNNIILIDESQRLTDYQINNIISRNNSTVIFSGDPKQVLGNNESGPKLHDFVDDNNIPVISLKNKIRSNASLSEFIKGLMDYNYKVDKKHPIEKDKISLEYFDNHLEAISYMQQLSREGEYEVMTLPGSIGYSVDEYTQYNKVFGQNAFTVIGQEFDNVATLIGPNISYSDNGKLYSFNTYYALLVY